MIKLFRSLIIIFVFIIVAGFVAFPYLSTNSEPTVYYLYTQDSKYPDWLFKISAIPVLFASYAAYQKPALSLKPFTGLNAKKAIRRGEFLIIGAHGGQGMLKTDDGLWIKPGEGRFPKLKRVFFGACEINDNRKNWEEMFPNAKISGASEEFFPWQGALYVFFKAPIEILLSSKETRKN